MKKLAATLFAAAVAVLIASQAMAQPAEGDRPARDGDRPARPEGGRGPGGPGGPGGAGGGPEAFVDRMMQLDKDGDGKISKSELPERMQRIMERADEDKDGFISRKEVEAMAQRFGQGRGPGGSGGPGGPGGPGQDGRRFGGPPNPEQIVEAAMKFDADGDGKLDKQELTKYAESIANRFRGGREGGQQGDRSRSGRRGDGDRPRGEGDRPRGEGGERPRRPEGDRPDGERPARPRPEDL